MSAIDRFAKRKALGLAAVALPAEARNSLVGRPLDPTESARLSESIAIALKTKASDRLNARLDESKIVLLRTVAVPFGLGHLVSAYDRVGGDVHTVHNVRAGVWANDDKREAFENRGDYSEIKDACHQTKHYIGTNRKASEMREAGELRDGYTGELLDRGKGGHDLDHIISAKSVHDDAGVFLSGRSVPDVSTRPENLTPTDPAINRSKKSMSPQQYAAWLASREQVRKLRIAEFEARTDLTPKEQQQLRKLQQQQKVDAEKLKEKEAEAREAIDEEANSWYRSGEFADEVLKSTVTNAGKAGLMAFFGEFLVEFVAAAYDEIRDLFVNGRRDDSIWKDLEARLVRVSDRLVARRDAAFKALGAGSLGGFVAALVQVVVNTVRTTSRRAARMLREGGQALVRSITTLAFPSDGVSTRESLFAMTHLVAGTTIVLGGIALEEIIEDAIKIYVPPLAVIAEPTAVVLAGVLAGLSTVLHAAFLDMWDPYGVLEEQDLRSMVAALDADIETARTASFALPAPR